MIPEHEKERFIATETVIPDIDNIDLILKEVDVYAPGVKLPALGLNVIDILENSTRQYTLYIKEGTIVNDRKFFAQVQWLLEQNKYLDILKHKDVWILFNSEFVKTKSGKDYWSMNLRPNHYFDDNTWSKS